jgi:hypothetical protein
MNGSEEEEEENIYKFCIILVPAFIVINALACQLEEAICKSGHSQEKCCNLEHVTSIRSKAKMIETAAKPRIIALASNTMHYRVVSDEDLVYLSDAVVKLLMSPRL